MRLPILPHLHLQIERWKWNKDLGLYVSTFGHFRDAERKPIPQKIDGGGYMRVYAPHMRHWHSAHRAVLETWRPTPASDKLTVDHLDHNKRKNTLDNLEWVTRAENQARAINDFLQETKPQTEINFNPSDARNLKYWISMVEQHKAFLRSGDGHVYSKKALEQTFPRIRLTHVVAVSQSGGSYFGKKWKLVVREGVM